MLGHKLDEVLVDTMMRCWWTQEDEVLGHTERGAWTQAGRGACGHYDEVANSPSTCLHTVVTAYVRSINLTGQSDDAIWPDVVG